MLDKITINGKECIVINDDINTNDLSALADEALCELATRIFKKHKFNLVDMLCLDVNDAWDKFYDIKSEMSEAMKGCTVVQYFTRVMCDRLTDGGALNKCKAYGLWLDPAEYDAVVFGDDCGDDCDEDCQYYINKY